MNSYESLEALFKNNMQQDLNNEEILQQQIRSLENEVMKINSNMGYLPTSREIEALPDLKFLAEITQCFRNDTNLFDHNMKNFPQRREEIINALFGQVTRSFLKTKIYNDKTIIQTADQLFENLVIWCTRQLPQENLSQMQILSTIIDYNVDYYKVNGKEDQIVFPFGYNELKNDTEEHKQWVDSLKVGDKVDYLKYNLDKKFWIPAVVKQVNDWCIKVQVEQEQFEGQVSKKYRELLPYRSKLEEYKWRLDLKQGDKVDYYNYSRSWRLCEVQEVEERQQDDQTVVVLTLTDCDNEDMYEKQTYNTNIFSGSIAPAGKYSNFDNFNYDLDDEYFLKNQTKKRYAILRRSNSPAQSIYFVKYINLFGEYGGFDYIINVFSKKIEVHDFTLQCLMSIVRSSIENLVRPFVQENGEILLKNLQSYLKQNSKENLRKIDKNNLKTILETINALVYRVYKKNDAQKICQKNEVDLALICLKSEFLEKQLFGSKILESLEKKVRNLDTIMDQKELVEILQQQNIFQIIIKGHPSLIQKGHSIIKTLISMDKVSEEELQNLWKQILKTDMESRNALLSLLKQTLGDFTQEQLLYFLDKMIESAHKITDQELFDVLFQLKKIGWNRYNNYDIVQKVNEVLWEIIQSKQDMKKEYMKEVIKNFVEFIQAHDNYQYIDKIIDNICRNENQIRNIKLLKKIIDSESLQGTIIEKIKNKQLIKHMIDSIVSVVISKKRNQEDTISVNSFTDQQKKLIEKQLSFIQKIYQLSIQIVRFSEIKKIWMLFRENNLDYNYMYQWMLGYFVKESEEGFAQKYQNFFDQNIQCLKEKNNKNNLVSFFWILMIKMNINNKNLINHRVSLETNSIGNTFNRTKNFILLNKEISGFVGIDKLWEIYHTTENEQLEQKLCEHFAKLYSEPMPEIPFNKELYQKEKQNLVQQCIQRINDQDSLKVRKSCRLLKYLILNEELYGLGDLKSWNYFLEDSKFGLSYERENSYYFRDKSTTVLIKKNKTLAQLKKKIADESSLNFRSIQLEQTDVPNNKFAHLYNSLTLKELITTDNKHFTLKELELPEKEMVPILTSTNDKFTEKALAVFSEIFQDYSTDGKMSRYQLAQFTMKATDGTFCSEDDDRIRQVFRKYGQEDKEFILQDGFIKFFLDSATHSHDKLNTVKYNLQSLGYDKTLTLKKQRNSNQYKQTLKQNLRYKLALNNEFFKSLYDKIGDDKNNGALELIQFLTPNVKVIQELIDEPISKLRQESSSLQWNYLCVILYQLIFKQKRMRKLLESFDVSFNESQAKVFFNKLYNIKFVEIIMRKVQSFDQNDSDQMQQMYFALKCLEGLFQIGIDFIRQDFIEDTINFIAYSMKLKRLKNKEKNKEKKNAETQVETQSQQDYGPKEKNENKDKQKTNKSVQDLMNIKEILTSSQDNIQEFLKQIPFQKLNIFLIQILQVVIDNEVKYKFTYKKSMVKTLVIMLLSSLTLCSKNLKTLLNNEKGILKELLIKGLTSQKSLYRLCFKNFYTYLTSNLQDFEHKRAFLKVIMTSIKETQENDEMHVLIELASNILNEISEMKQKQEKTQLHEEFDFSKIFMEFAEKLYKYKTKETDFDVQEDNTLIAKLTFMEKIILADEYVLQEIDDNKKKDLVKFLYKQCLFNIQNNKINFANILCKSNKSRQKAHDLMTLIAMNDVKLTILTLLLFKPLSELLPEIMTQKQLQNKNGRKKQYSYTGLRNPGCICYMNAMLQQFYCIPTFRYGILMADDYKEVEPFQTQDMQVIDDNVFHQLQKMFAYLDYSQRQDFFPQEFCMSYKDSSKQRVNVLVQQDAYEFLNMIFDKMETSLKPTPFQGIIDSVFMGRNCCVFTCQGCGFKRERLEINYNLSLEVKNIENLEESFEKFIQKEVISDFMCDSCKKKEDVVKQTFLKELPNVMVIHLQKIIFDLEILTNIKISSRYEFPQNLNLQKFVYKEEQTQQDEDDEQEKQPDDPEDYEYKLVGVVIHRGNAHFGHYISLINTNRKDPNRQDNTKDEWLEFDDSKISVFNMNNFEEECFGSKIENDYHQGLYNIEGNVSQSAYILVYDKVKKSKVKFKFKEENKNEIDKLKNNLIDKENYKFENDVLETDFYNLDMYIPEKYKQEIELDNINQILENLLFSSNFTNTFATMLYETDFPIISVDMPPPRNLTEYQKALAKMILKIVPKFFVKVYCVAYQNYKIKKIAQVIESALMILPEMILEFFRDFFFPNQMFLKYQLMNSMDSGIQYSINHLITVSTTILIQQYNLRMQSQVFKDPQNEQEHAITILTYIIDNFFLNQLKEFEQQKISRKTQFFFQSLKNICILNPTIKEYLLQSNQLNYLVTLYQKQDTSNCRNAEQALSHLLHIIYLILQTVQSKMQDQNKENLNQLSDYFNFFATPQLLFKIMKEDYRFNKYNSLNLLTELVCRDDFVNSFIVIKKCLKCLTTAGDLPSIPYLEALVTLMQLEDQYQDVRIKAILGQPILSEQHIKDKSKSYYIYGLSKESSLKRTVHKYLSPFGSEQGLVQGIYSHKDNNEVICLLYIHYVLVAAIQDQKIMNYLTNLPPYNYVSSNLFDWVQNYVQYNMKNMQKSYNAPKSDLMYNYFQNLDQILIDFEKRFKQSLQIEYNFTEELSQNYKYFQTEQLEELDTVKDNYMIGKTVAQNLVQKKVLYSDNDEEFSINVHLIKVSLMKNRTNGFENLDIPKEFMSHDSYLQKSQLTGQFQKFVGSQNQHYYNFDDENESKEELRPLGDDSDDDDIEQDKIEDEQNEMLIQDEETEDETNYINKRYILRLSYNNNCREYYSLQIKIENNGNENFEENEWIVLAKSGKQDYLIMNTTLENVDGNFNGLQISARFLENEDRNLQNCEDLFQTSYEEIFKLQMKEE